MISYPVSDGQFLHHITFIITDPMRSAKSTFVENLLLHHKEVLDVEFDYISIMIGTDEKLYPASKKYTQIK